MKIFNIKIIYQFNLLRKDRMLRFNLKIRSSNIMSIRVTLKRRTGQKESKKEWIYV